MRIRDRTDAWAFVHNLIHTLGQAGTLEGWYGEFTLKLNDDHPKCADTAIAGVITIGLKDFMQLAGAFGKDGLQAEHKGTGPWLYFDRYAGHEDEILDAAVDEFVKRKEAYEEAHSMGDV